MRERSGLSCGCVLALLGALAWAPVEAAGPPAPARIARPAAARPHPGVAAAPRTLTRAAAPRGATARAPDRLPAAARPVAARAPVAGTRLGLPHGIPAPPRAPARLGAAHPGAVGGPAAYDARKGAAVGAALMGRRH